MTIVIRRVREEHGHFGNMSPHPVTYQEVEWRTTEALFQALRFNDEANREAIRQEKSPMGAKMKAKSLRSRMLREEQEAAVMPLSEQDLDNMRLVLRLKIEQHPEIKQALIDTGNELIVEDCTKRQRGTGLFWGAALLDDRWEGKNWLGRLWIELRDELSGGNQ